MDEAVKFDAHLESIEAFHRRAHMITPSDCDPMGDLIVHLWQRIKLLEEEVSILMMEREEVIQAAEAIPTFPIPVHHRRCADRVPNQPCICAEINAESDAGGSEP